MAHEKIAIIEDEIIVAKAIESTLTNYGYDVPFISRSGTEAIAKIESQQADLVLMDIRLSGGFEGIEAANQIRKKHDIPVIYLTAYADDDTLLRAKETLPYGFLVKPVEDRELYAAIEIALQRRKIEHDLFNKVYVKKIRDLALSNRELKEDIFELLKLSTKLLKNQQELEMNLKNESILALAAIQLNLTYNIEDSLDSFLMCISRVAEFSKIEVHQFDKKNASSILKGSSGAPRKISIENADSININMISKSLEKVKSGEFVILSNLSGLASDEIAFFKKLDIKSVLMFPLWFDNQIKGFIFYGKDVEYRWDSIEIATFKRISNLISNAWERSFKTQSQTKFEGNGLVDLGNVLKSIVWLIKDIVKKQGIDFNLKAGRQKLAVAGKCEYYEQIFFNLIIQILHALAKVQRDSKIIKISIQKKERFAEVKIQDNGIKLPKAIKGRLLDTYCLSQQKDLIFVGLPLIKNLISELGGCVRIRNAKFNGLIFSLRFPLSINNAGQKDIANP